MAKDKFYSEVEKIVSKLDMIFKDKEGYYYFNIYVSRYDLANFDDYLKELFEDNNFKSANDVYTTINEYIYEMYEEYESDMYSEVCEEVANVIDAELFAEFDNDYDYLRECVQDIVYSNYDDVFSTAYATTFNCFVALTDTNEEMNYDFRDTDLYNYKDLTYKEFGELKNSNKFLCKSQGYKLKELYDVYINDENTKSKFIESLSDEYDNASYGGCFVFLFELSLEDFVNIKFNSPKLMISKNTMCGIFDWFNGSGGPLEVELEKDLVIPAGVYNLYADGEIGYSIDETYGLTQTAWRYGKVKYQQQKGKKK